MWEKLLKQTGVCLLVVLALLLSKHSNIPALANGADMVIKHMSVSYTAEDIKAAAKKSMQAMANVTGKMTDAVDVITGKPVYGDPIDEKYTGNKAAVYAVGGGQVTAVGENEEIGKYVKITHGDQGESLYGNLKTVNVSVPSNVKKGQIIGVYEKNSKADFYYSFQEFR